MVGITEDSQGGRVGKRKGKKREGEKVRGREAGQVKVRTETVKIQKVLCESASKTVMRQDFTMYTM